MDKCVTDTKFGASEEVHIEAHTWQGSVAGYLGDFRTQLVYILTGHMFDSKWQGRSGSNTKVIPSETPIKRRPDPKIDLIKFGQGSQPATRKRR